MNTRWKEIAGDMLEPKLKNIYSQFPVAFDKDTTIESDFQSTDDVMMKPDGIGFDKYKTNIWNRILL